MPSPRYSALARQLTDAGIASKYVARLREELDDHLTDLEAELAADRTRAAARVAAARRIGDPDVILAEFGKRPELRAFVYRSRGLIRVLRLVAVLMCAARRLRHAFVSRKPRLARLGVAAGAGVIVTGTLLLMMSLVTTRQWSRPVGPVSDRIQTTGEERSASATETATPPPIHISLPDPLRDAGPELRAVAWSTEVSIETRPVLMAFPRPGDSEYRPIVKAPPVYPALAASRGIEGYVVVEFTVTRTGSVRDVVVVESSDELFVEAAVRATYRFRYEPRIVDGVPIEVSGIRNRISFKLRA